MLSQSDYRAAQEVAAYYRKPESFSYDRKIKLYELIEHNKGIHYVALSINGNYCKPKKKKS